MSSPPHSREAPRIADYELLKLIGSGSYGDVWLARGVTSVFCAVKVVWRDRFEDLRPYEREFEGVTRFAAISLREPSQLALLHAGRSADGSYFFYVMELADDVSRGREIDPAAYRPRTLREVHHEHERLPVAEVVALGVALSRALATLHAAGLVHRDIKPSNVVFVGGVPKLADVGLVAAASAGLTFVGTEGYVPREGPGAPAADVFALGKVLYELATGLDRQDWPRLPANLTDWPDRRALLELNEVLVRACEPDPTARFADAGALLDELLLLQAGKSVRRLRAAERRTARALRFAAVLAVIAAMTGGGMWLEHQRAARAEAERDALARRRTYSGNLASAQRAIEASDLGRARRLLQELEPKPGQPDLRDFEWHVLARQARGDPHETIRPAGLAINRLALSPDETILAVHDDSRTVTLYRADDRRELARIPGVSSLAGFSPDGTWIVGTDPTPAPQQWAVRDGKPGAPGEKKALRVMAATTDRIAAVLGTSPPIRAALWDYEKHTETNAINLDPDGSSTPWLVFRNGASADGRTLAIALVRGGSSSAEFRLTAVHWGTTVSTRSCDLGRNRPSAVGVDARGPWAVLDVSGAVWRENDTGWTETPERLPAGTRKFITSGESSDAFSIAGHGRDISWLNPRVLDRPARGHGALIADLVAAPKLQTAFSAATDGSLFAWPLRGPTIERDALQVWDSNAGSTCVVFTADGRRCWVPWDGKSCARIDLASLSPSARIEGMLWPVILAPRGVIGIAVDTGLLRADPESGEVLERIPVSTSPVKFAVGARDGQVLAVIDQAGDLLAVDRTGAHRVRSGWNRYFTLCLDEQGQRLIGTNTNRQLVCLSWPDGERQLWEETLPALAPLVTVLPNQREMLVALEDGSLEIRTLANGRVVRHIDSGSAAPQTFAVAPSGRRVFVGGLEGDIHCFDPSLWEEVHALPLGRSVRLHRLVVSPDGATIAGLTKTGMLHVVRAK